MGAPLSRGQIDEIVRLVRARAVFAEEPITGLTVAGVAGDLAAHEAETADAHDASAISFSPVGSVAATTVQAAIAEVDGDVTALAAATTASLAGKQPLDATLTALAAADWSGNSLPIGSGVNTVAQVTFAASTFPARASTGNLVAKTITDFGLSLVDDANAAAAQATLGLVIGTNVQAQDTELQAIAGLVSASNKLIRFTGSGTADLLDFSIDGTLAANSDTTLPSQKAVKTYIDALLAAQDALVFKGGIDCSASPNYPAADAGHFYKITVAGKIGGASGSVVQSGDSMYCTVDGSAAGTQAAVGANWVIVQVNIDGAVVGPASAVDSRVAMFDGATGKLIKDSGLTLAGTNTGDETGARLATLHHAASVKSALVDADEVTGGDSAASFGLIRTTWTSVKAFLKTYFDTLYLNQNTTGTASNVTGTVLVANGGTGRITSTTAYGLLAAGTTATGAHQTLPAGATTDILVGGGAAALPAWTAASGTGSPLRQGTPTITTPVINGMTGDNTAWAFGATTTSFTRDTAGKIGIGTTAPGKQFELRGVGTLAAIRMLESATFGVSWDINVGAANEMAFSNNAGSPLAYKFTNGSVSTNQHFLSTAPVTETTATHTVATTTTYLIANRAGTITVTLPAAASFTGREIVIKTLQAQTVVSASANVVPLNGGAAATAILAATIGKWAQLVSNGTSWEIMTAN